MWTNADSSGAGEVEAESEVESEDDNEDSYSYELDCDGDGVKDYYLDDVCWLPEVKNGYRYPVVVVNEEGIRAFYDQAGRVYYYFDCYKDYSEEFCDKHDIKSENFPIVAEKVSKPKVVEVVEVEEDEEED